MGIIKPNNYTEKELTVALVADALSHPLRTRIISMLHENHFLRNVDLADLFKLTKPTISNHLYKLKSAGLIEYAYHTHFYEIRLNSDRLKIIRKFIDFE